MFGLHVVGHASVKVRGEVAQVALEFELVIVLVPDVGL
jgi:hypothetical protein